MYCNNFQQYAALANSFLTSATLKKVVHNIFGMSMIISLSYGLYSLRTLTRYKPEMPDFFVPELTVLVHNLSFFFYIWRRKMNSELVQLVQLKRTYRFTVVFVQVIYTIYILLKKNSNVNLKITIIYINNNQLILEELIRAMPQLTERNQLM